ncbi:MAG: M48 family metallopeptidase [Clostridia bacterium]|nr:M48 family metallopeptidase [Clostridia bacterium]
MSIGKDTIQSLCAAIYPECQKNGVAYPTIRYRNMVSCWGSCQPKRGVLMFNFPHSLESFYMRSIWRFLT